MSHPPSFVEGMKRHVPINHFNYDEEQISEKKRALKRLAEEWPDVDRTWREWVYDMCVNTSPEEMEAMKKRVIESEEK